MENNWLAHGSTLLEKSEVEIGDTISWNPGPHFMLLCQITKRPLHSFYYEKAAAAMIKHGINVLQLVTEFLNVDQTPVMAFDAPLFALVKFVQ